MNSPRTYLPHGLCTTILLVAACTKLESGSDQFAATGGQGSTNVTSAQGGAGDGGRTADESGSASGGSTAGSGGASKFASAGVTAAGGASSSGGASNSGGASSVTCTNPQGFNGLGCYSCAPTNITTFESACTDSLCTSFPNSKRLTKLKPDGALPSLPIVSAGGSSAGGSGAGGSGAGGTSAVSGGTSAGGTTSGTTGYSPFACESLKSQGTVVYVTGSSASKPFLQQIAQQLSYSNVYIVYTSTGSCVGVDAILNQTLMIAGPAPAPATTALYWKNSASTGDSCALPSAGVPADIGISDVFAQTCPGFEVASLEAQQVRDAHGPIQTMTFVVPPASKYTEISAQAAYFVFGFGADGGVLDATVSHGIWNDEAYLFQRSPTSGTQAMIAAAIGVPAASWKGKRHSASADVAASILAAGSNVDTADKALGILAADYIDSNNIRAQIRMLAFQDTNQPCAVYPDSTADTHDKRNVRDGHYPIWSPMHLLYRVDQSGSPANASNKLQILDILGYFSGSKALPNGIKLLDVYAQSGLIPECAMRVSRLKDGGNLQPYVPSSPCACVFEAKAGATTCKTCTVQGDCAAGEICSIGYCEK